MSGVETRFYTTVHRNFKAKFHYEKNNNPYLCGTPDIWYSGAAADLWVEYKYLNKVPVRADIHVNKMLSKRQLMWLDKRCVEGRNVAVILGTPEGHWVYRYGDWNKPLPVAKLRSTMTATVDISRYIEEFVMTGCPARSVVSHRLPPCQP